MVNVEKFIEKAVQQIRDAAGDEKVVMALSGGVDSSVCAALATRAIGDRLVPIYVDTGLMRKGETDRIRTLFDGNLRVVDAADEFFAALAGITDPEEKRKAIGERFVRVFEREAKRTGATMLLQGTIYPDRIESEGGIKSHHNALQGRGPRGRRRARPPGGDPAPDALPRAGACRPGPRRGDPREDRDRP